jgi:trk system potassium uptake protein TrkH
VPVVAAFVFAYFVLVAVTAVFGALCGLDPFTAFTAAASMAGNVGPAFGALGPAAHYGDIPAALKWWYMLVMLAGRLEIYTLLIMAGNLAGRLAGGEKHKQERGKKS